MTMEFNKNAQTAVSLRDSGDETVLQEPALNSQSLEFNAGEVLAAPIAAQLLVGQGSLQVGLEMQTISSLPRVADYWDDPFYSATFTDSELSFALLQPDPVVPLAGYHCVKQALRKCDGSYRVLALNQIAVGQDAAGQIFLTVKTKQGIERLSHGVSVSHVADLVTAIVIAVPVLAAAAQPLPMTQPSPAKVAIESDGEETAGAESLEDRLMQVFSEILKCPCDTETCRQNTPQWDSLKHVELILTLEEKFNVRFPEEAMATLNSVTQILAFIRNARAA